MMNFDYLKNIDELAQLYRYCDIAERNTFVEPEVAAMSARRGVEWMTKAILRMKNSDISERTTLREMTEHPDFTGFVNNGDLLRGVDYVRRFGNRAAHDGNVSKAQAFFCLLNLYNFVGGVLVKLQVVSHLAPLNKELIPTEQTRPTPVLVHDTPNSSEVFVEHVEPAAVATAADVEPELHWDAISEAETRRLFIDLMLREAGWEVLTTNGDIQAGKACVEVEVQGMPNNQGVGYADYVLFGHNGKPLAVVEAKRTSVDPSKGRHQAELYADCLERQYGVRPVIYFTNGFTTKIIDGMGYPERQLFAFHTEKDLEWIHQQRNRHALIDLTVKDSISDRYYQKGSIKALAEWFNNNHRRGLLVMATGTGKTRTSISLVDVLMRNGWVKNVLFLADRTSLVKQAKKNFNKLMPDATICELSDHSADKDLNARIVFSTYQTMINYVDNDEKKFSVGRFDLIIIDEAHRSVFGKFGAIFNYFDSLLVGLTATPRDQIDKSTYDLLGCDNGSPNYAYELDEAVADGFLVDYHAFQRGSKIVNEGIKYDDLSAEEKEALEKIWEYEAALVDPDAVPQPRDVQEREIYKYIFNEDTIDHVLQDLMTNGLKVNSGEMIGKSVIFAFNHKHADMIVRRFNALYPEYGHEFCRLIDNYEKYAQDLIDRFEQREKMPQIAVSVDMLDTGIDVPDILNLVFFKRVKSKIKFMQMIGRGTRLSPGIFGEGKDKECFYIFDWCGNFRYFGQNPKGTETKKTTSLTERIFGVRADIACALQDACWQEDEFAKGFHDELKTILHSQVAALNDNLISVRERWEIVNRFRQKENWTYISAVDVLEMKNEIAPLLTSATADEAALKFDLLALYVQLSLVDDTFNSDKYEGKITLIAQALQKLASIPQVQEKMTTIKEVCTSQFWNEKSLNSIERVRIELRDLLKFLQGQSGKTFEVDIEDMITDEGEVERPSARVSYREKVLDFLAANRDLPVLNKIKNFEKLTAEDIAELERIMWEELGTKQDYTSFVRQRNLSEEISVAAFIRTLDGINRQKAVELFTEFISENSLNADQEEYLKSILDYVCENGDIQGDALVNNDALRGFDWSEVFPGKLPQVFKFVELLHDTITAA